MSLACPLCGADTRVVDTTPSGANTRRRRECTVATCRGRVSSLEVALPEGVTMQGEDVVLVRRAELEVIAAACERVLEVSRASRRRGA